MSSPEPALRLALYFRISSDPDGTCEAIKRQLRHCRGLARLKGWKVAKVFEDLNISA